jgi:hypothetical protein
VILLQRLIRGRCAQNNSFEGKFRRAALIKELRESVEDTIDLAETIASIYDKRLARDALITASSVDAAVGLVASALFGVYADEYVR